ncbi:MAG: hypothetical protein WCK96_11820 [Methylococcales bacterium]
MTFKLKCNACGAIETFNCSELEWDCIESKGVNEEVDSLHQAVFEISCPCGNDMKVTFDCREHPEGEREIENATPLGAELIDNNCQFDVKGKYSD